MIYLFSKIWLRSKLIQLYDQLNLYVLIIEHIG